VRWEWEPSSTQHLFVNLETRTSRGCLSFPRMSYRAIRLCFVPTGIPSLWDILVTVFSLNCAHVFLPPHHALLFRVVFKILFSSHFFPFYFVFIFFRTSCSFFTLDGVIVYVGLSWRNHPPPPNKNSFCGENFKDSVIPSTTSTQKSGPLHCLWSDHSGNLLYPLTWEKNPKYPFEWGFVEILDKMESICIARKNKDFLTWVDTISITPQIFYNLLLFFAIWFPYEKKKT